MNPITVVLALGRAKRRVGANFADVPTAEVAAGSSTLLLQHRPTKWNTDVVTA